MLCDVVRRCRRRRRRWAHAPVIHAASHFDQKKRVAWVPISMHTCGSFFYNYGAPLGGPSGRRSSAIILKMVNLLLSACPLSPQMIALIWGFFSLNHLGPAICIKFKWVILNACTCIQTTPYHDYSWTFKSNINLCLLLNYCLSTKD